MYAFVSLDIREPVSDGISGCPYNRTHRANSQNGSERTNKAVTNNGAYLNNKTQPCCAQTNRKTGGDDDYNGTGSIGGAFQFSDRSRTVAKPGFSRWMVPPAALCVHLCIGQAYAFSVFNLPMTKLVGISQSAPNDWNIPELGWIFSIAIFVLGFSAAIFGRWVEEGGPRRAMFTAALCWAGGFIISAIGVYVHNLWSCILSTA